MNSIDFVVIIILLAAFANGMAKGFFKTLLGPLALVICLLIAYKIYFTSGNIFLAFAITIFGPFLLKLLLKLLLKSWNKTVNKESKPSPISRVCGASFGIFWSSLHIALILLFFAFLPSRIPFFAKIQNNIKNSASYNFVDYCFADTIPFKAFDANAISQSMTDPKKFNNISATKEYKALNNDSRVKELQNDPEIAEMVKTKNYTQLMAHPKVQAVMKDEKVVKKFFDFGMKVSEQNAREEKKSSR